jgi:PPM family protein phosphatase
MKVRAGVRTDIGRARRRNEDAYIANDPLFAVADGMGGHRGGDVASALALESLEAPGGEPATEDFPKLIAQIKEANQRVLERGEADRDLRGMGTTLTAVLAADGKARVAHVGDSRAYMLRDGKLQQLTEDHTLVQRMVREGRLSEEEAAIHPQRSVLTRVLGVEGDIPVDELTLDLSEGDRLLICTDGLTSMLDRDTIREILESESDPQAAADRLVEEANGAGGDDNITVIVLDVVGDDAALPARAPTGVVGGKASATGPIEEARDATRVTAIDRGPSVPSRRIRWKRVAIWTGAIVAVVAAGLIGTRIYIDRQWYVGDDDGRVAIFNGIPTTVLGFHLSHVEESTDLSSAQAERLQYWRDRLEEGITAETFQQAQSIVAQIRQDLQAPSPSTSPTPSPTPGPTSSGGG